jgi:hypothetical protein
MPRRPLFTQWESRRLACALRGHPQEVGFANPDAIGARGMFALRKSAPDAERDLIIETACRCGRRREIPDSH